MKAWRIYGVSDLKLDEIDYPKLKPSEVIVRVRTIQLSVTEIASLMGLYESLNGFSFYRPLERLLEGGGPIEYLGHEFCGEVAEVGKDVVGFKVGERVVAVPSIPCLECKPCSKGDPQYCVSRIKFVPPGALREYLALSPRFLVKVPDSISDGEAAFVNPLHAAVGCVIDATPSIIDTAVVLGCGMVGLSVVQLLSRNVNTTIATDVDKNKLELAKKMGADIAINSSTFDPVPTILKELNGEGADLVFDCAGGSPKVGLSGGETLNQAVKIVRKFGKIVQVAIISGSIPFSPMALYQKGIKYVFPQSSPRDYVKIYEYAIKTLTAGRVDVKSMITHQLRGIEKIPEAIEISMNKKKYQAITAQVAFV